VSASDPAVAVALVSFGGVRVTRDSGRTWRVLKGPPGLARYECLHTVLAGDGTVGPGCTNGIWMTAPGTVDSPVHRSGRRRLAQLADLAHDFDEIPVRVVDAQLPCRSRAPGEHALDALECVETAEILRVRRELP
jgi:hypothetical protein